MLKIEEKSISANLKEIRKLKKVDEVKLNNENEQMKLKIAELKQKFLQKVDSENNAKINTKSLFLQDEIDYLVYRDLSLDTSIKEKDKAIGELKNKIVALAKNLHSNHIKFPRIEAIKLPF